MARAALLDVDGTLIDANYQHALAWYRAFRQHGIVLPVWRIHRHVGMGGDQLVPALVGEQVDEGTTKDDGEATKPEPDLVRAALEQAGPTDGAVMVGDTPRDSEAARKA